MSDSLSDLYILRQHTLSLPLARTLACQWVKQAEQEFGMTCTYTEGPTGDQVNFVRSGVEGSLMVTQEQFELRARLGFLLSAFKTKIEAQVAQNLDQLLLQATASGDPAR
jgi:putative polyhydroxyalkanoate system protein